MEELQRYLMQEQLEKLSPEDQEQLQRLVARLRQLPPDELEAIMFFVEDLAARTTRH